MSARANVAGVLFRAPAKKTSKAGKPYVIATIREGASDTTRWWRCFAFSDSFVDEIADGEAIAVSGELGAELYTPEGGGSRVSWSIKADAVLTARRPKKEPKERRTKTAPAQRGSLTAAASRAAPDMGGDLDDEVPF
jgi:hypothetical protein